jgi:hypothetical protein
MDNNKIIEMDKLINDIMNDNTYIFDNNLICLHRLDCFDFIKKFIEIFMIIRDNYTYNICMNEDNFDKLLDIIDNGIYNMNMYIKTIQENELYKWILIRDIIEGLLSSKKRITQSSFYLLNTLFNKKLKI